MNIKEELLKEHSLGNVTKIAAYAGSSVENFKLLMECFLSAEYRIAQRAVRSVSQVAITNPVIIKPFISDLVAQLKRKDVHNAVLRNSLRILLDMEIPEEFHGEIMNACFGFIEDPATPVAIKAFSLTTLHNLSKFYPEIRQELELIIEERMDLETAAFKARAKKILKKSSLGTTP